MPSRRTSKSSTTAATRGAAGAFPIAGIGASAGGLEAYNQLLQALPADSGMAFVVISHLSPSHASMMAEILGRATRMPVTQVEDEARVQPNHVYVIPPDRSMIIDAGRLRLLPRQPGRAAHHPIDQFFESLAEDQQFKAIGVVLSGTASDGTLGLQHIRANGGITFAQDESAQHRGMPESAVLGGHVDFVLSPEKIAAELVRLSRHPHLRKSAPLTRASDRPHLTGILQLMQGTLGTDFSDYKVQTLSRRITRRMAVRQVDGIDAYLELLKRDRGELEALYQDILVHVTTFFRHPEAYAHLQRQILPRLARGRNPKEPLRIWVLGCSTGEEAYSIAISIAEYCEEQGMAVAAQIFATDLNAVGIEKARGGLYSRNIADHVSAERLRRCFEETNGGYRIIKSIREMCVFAQHDGLRDPPFSRMDLICCRNLLIDLEPRLQQRLLPLLHYALSPNGVLWLGNAESIGSFRQLFEQEDSHFRFFRRKPGPPLGAGVLVPTGFVSRTRREVTTHPRGQAGLPLRSEALLEADRLLVSRYAPPGVIVDQGGDIVQFRGDTNRFLAPAPGKPSPNLMNMLRDGLLVGVRTAMAKARKHQVVVRKEGLRVCTSGAYHQVDIEVVPLRAEPGQNPLLMLLFHERGDVPSVGAPRHRARENASSEITRLRQEVVSAREYLQSVIEQQEIANQELQAAHEEVITTNHHLQCINEELETSREEIQSTGEELTTVNDELQLRNDQLSRSNNDLLNLLNSAQMAMVVLGPDRRIRRFTRMAERLFNLIPTDVGRPLRHLNSNIDVPDLEEMAEEVMASATDRQREVQDREGRWQLLRIWPYLSPDGSVDGAVLILIDIDVIKTDEARLRSNEARLRIIQDQAPIGIYELDDHGRFYRVNDRLCEITGYPREELLGRRFTEVIHPDDIKHIQAGFDLLVSGAVTTYRSEKRYRRPDGNLVWVDVHRFLVDDGRSRFVVGLLEDITERTLAGQREREREARFREVADGVPVLIWSSGADGIEFVNKAYRDFVGADESDLQGSGWIRYVHPDDRDGYHAAFREATTRQAPFEHQFRLRNVEGYYHWVMSLAVHRYNTRGESTGFIGSMFDIGEFKEAEASLLEADAAKNSFIAMLAHELRNPLASLVNAAQILRTERASPEQRDWAQGVLQRQLTNLTRMVEDLLDISRVTRGKIELRQERVELQSILRAATELFQGNGEADRVSLQVHLPAEPIRIVGDPVRLEQIFNNLLNNAFKFTPDGGAVRLEASIGPDGEQPGARVVVTDTGEGIAPEMLSHVFDPFVQGPRPSATSQSGLGIGLALVRRLTELHGGSVTVRSGGIGRGSQFIVSLPLPSERNGD